MRDTLNSDPLALWLGPSAPGDGAVDTSAADRLAGRVTAAAARVDELVRLRDEARQRITDVTTAATAARSARDDAVAAWHRAAAKIAPGALPSPPADQADLSARLAGLGTLQAGGRWTRLAAELDLLDRELATATAGFKEAE